MRLLQILALSALIALTGCKPPEQHATSQTVHVRQVRNSSDDSLLFWYIIYSNTLNSACPCYVASSPTPVTSMSSLNFTRTTEVPATAGNSETTKVEQEQTEQESNEALPEETQEGLSQDAEAVDTGADSTDGIGDGPNDTSMSDSGSGDSGGGDYGGGDSGGGDSGGGGGE